MKRNITLKPYAMSIEWPNPRYYQQTSSGKDIYSGIVYWKRQSTSLQGSKSDFEKIVFAIRSKSHYEKKWCSAKYEDGIMLFGSHYILWENGTTPTMILPYSVALRFAAELEVIAAEMESDDLDGANLIEALDRVCQEAEEIKIQRCTEGDLLSVRKRLSRDPRSLFYKASPRDLKMSRYEIVQKTHSLLSAVEKQKTRSK